MRDRLGSDRRAGAHLKQVDESEVRNIRRTIGKKWNKRSSLRLMMA
jgi:hypothetical protein